MGGTFFGLNVATRGLFAAQKSLSVVNHNLNNVNTPGFSRQKAIQTASRPLSIADGTGMLGTGVEVVSIERVRDEYLDYKYWSENESFGEWNAKTELLNEMQAIFNEPSDSGYATVVDEFFDSLQELAKEPSSLATRALVRERGVTTAKYFNSLAYHLEKMQSDIDSRVKLEVDNINSITERITQLNKQIYTAELDGSLANDLRDQRGVLVDDLSKLINIDVNEIKVGKLPNGREDIHFAITVSGKDIVNHFDKTDLVVKQRETKLNEEDVEKLYEVSWEDGNKLKVKSGELRGYLDIRDGNEGLNGSPSYRGIPSYINKINTFVRTFAKAFNEGFIDSDGDGTIDDISGHADGYMLNSVEGDAPSGVRFFTITGDDGNPIDSTTFINGKTTMSDITSEYDNITAKNFAVSEDIMNDLNTISTGNAPGEVGNIENLNSIIKMRHNVYMFEEGAPEDYIKAAVAGLGIDGQQAERLTSIQNVIIKQIENRRLSDSGVSIDEEMTNLVKFQHAYNASAKMIVTIGELYDTLLNTFR